MAGGRPSEFDLIMCMEILEEVARGKNVIAVLESNDMYPSWSTFRRWKLEHNELQTMYVKAIQDKAVACDLEIDNIQQELRAKIIDPSTANVLIQTLKWKAAKYYPKMFGERVDVTSGNEKLKSILVVPEGIANELLKDIGTESNQLDNGSKENK